MIVNIDLFICPNLCPISMQEERDVPVLELDEREGWENDPGREWRMQGAWISERPHWSSKKALWLIFFEEMQ